MNHIICLLFCLSLTVGCADPKPEPEPDPQPEQIEMPDDENFEQVIIDRDNQIQEQLDRVFQAIGGEEALMKGRMLRVKSRTVMSIPGAVEEMGDDTMIIEDWFVFPNKSRRTVRTASTGELKVLCIVNGDKVWVKVADKKGVMDSPPPPNGLTKPPPLSMLDNFAGARERPDLFIPNIAEEDGCSYITFTIVDSRGNPSTISYIDPQTNLPVKEVKLWMHDIADMVSYQTTGPVKTVTTYDEYKDFDGTVIPTRIVMKQDDKTVMDLTVLEVEFPEEIDGALFEKPPEDEPATAEEEPVE